VMAVKLGCLVDPRTVWAYPLYEQGGQHDKILRLEAQLAELPRDETFSEHSATGSLVAVRRSPAAQLWFRGRLDQLSMYGKQLVASVFLIDYGEVLEGVKVEPCVRNMPSHISAEPPMAFQIVLAGLSPVSMDLDFMLGQNVMEVTPQRGWDQAAWMQVRKEIEMVDGIAEVRDWVVDQRGRYQGQLYLLDEGGERRLHLNQMLVERQFAVESQWQMENDMEETVDWENNKEFRALDHGSTELSSWELPGEEEYAGKSLEEFASEAFGESEVKDASFAASIWDDLGNIKGLGRGRMVKVREDDIDVTGSVNTSNRNGVGTQFQQNRMDKAKEFLNKLKGKKVVETGAADEEFWTAVRGKPSPGEPDRSASHLLPGGVFIGRHHEKVLAHLQADNMQDQKKKFEQFVAPRKEEK